MQQWPHIDGHTYSIFAAEIIDADIAYFAAPDGGGAAGYDEDFDLPPALRTN